MIKYHLGFWFISDSLVLKEALWQQRRAFLFGGRGGIHPRIHSGKGNLGERAVLFLQLLSRFETIKRKKKRPEKVKKNPENSCLLNAGNVPAFSMSG